MSDEKFVACETYPGYSHHIRRIGRRPVNLGGHYTPKPQSLCGRDVAWDTRIPITSVECRACQQRLGAANVEKAP